MSAIESFDEGSFKFLSTFSPCTVWWAGGTFPTVQHAYQAAKTKDHHARLELKKNPKAAWAWEFGQTLPERPHWDLVKDQVMLELNRMKFDWHRHPRMAIRLLDKTGTRALLNGNNYDDAYWGVDAKTLKGKNKLGILLMQVREEVRAAEALVGYYVVPPRSSKIIP